MLIRLTVFFFIFLSIFYLRGQNDEHPFLSFFKVDVVNDHVLIDFEMKSGATCFGINLYRSEDSVIFKKIDEIPGVCGSPDEPIRYSFADNNPPKNKLIYYQLEFGADGVSSIQSVEVIELLADNYAIRPNPVVDISFLFFENASKEKVEVFFYSSHGKFLFKSYTNERFFSIHSNNFNTGVVLFRLRFLSSQKIVVGKFVII